MELYYDGFLRIVADEETGIACWADKYMRWDMLTVELAKFIAKKCNEDWEHGYKLIDFINKIRRNK